MLYLRRGLELATEYIHYEPKASRYLCMSHNNDGNDNNSVSSEYIGGTISDHSLSKMVLAIKNGLKDELANINK